MFWVIALVAFALFIWRVVFAPIFPDSTLERVTKGMSKPNVVRILGEPQEKTSRSEWKYWRPMKSGWVQVFFDDEELVIEISSDSIF